MRSRSALDGFLTRSRHLQRPRQAADAHLANGAINARAAAVAASGAFTTIWMRNSTITANGRGLNAGPGAKIISFGGNAVSGNDVDGAFTLTFPQN
jgi:hypothetical protein